MTRAATLFLMLTCSLTFAGACGGTPSGSAKAPAGGSPASGPDTCSLLTADDIRAVLDIAPGASRFEHNQCVWPSADGTNDTLVQLMVTGTIARSYDDVVRQYREMDMDPADVIHPISGVGDFAVGLKATPVVQVYTGSTMVQVATFRNQEQHALELAKRVTKRLD